MTSVPKILAKMEANPKGIKFSELCKVCEHYFGQPRQTGGSHRVYRTLWQSEPYVNIQSKQGIAKSYQVNLAEHDEPIPEPLTKKQFSGKFMVRIPPEQHRALAIQAAEQGISINRLVSSKLTAN